MDFALFCLALAVLVKGADWLIEGAVSIAKHMGVSDFAIGLVLVAFGTSFPELVVSVISSAKGQGEIAVGNVIGSNIANILVGLGLASLFIPLSAKREFVRREIPVNFLVGLVFFFLINNINGRLELALFLTRSHGMVLLLIFSFYLYLVVLMSEKGEIEVGEGKYSLPKSVLLAVFGIAGVGFGGDMAVDKAVDLARALGVSKTFIGIFAVAFGTSLPEFVTSVVSARKGNADIILGNIAGSNIFNICLIPGVGALVGPLSIPPTANFHLAFMLFATTLLLASMFLGTKRTIERKEGILFLIFYIVYIIASFKIERV